MRRRKRIIKGIGKGFLALPIFLIGSSIIGSAAEWSPQEFQDSVRETSLRELVVTGDGPENKLLTAHTGKVLLSQKHITDMPVIFAEPDIVKTLQTLPGVSMGNEGFTSLLVRGGENDQNQFLFQCLPLYQVSHLGGVFSSFNVNTLETVEFFKGYFPSRYGGRVSSVVDISMKEPDFTTYHGSAGIGLLSVNAYLTGPIVRDKTAFSVAVRRTWLDVISIPALAIINLSEKGKGIKRIANYGFTDLNIRIDHRFSPILKATVTGYYGHDNLRIGEKESYTVNDGVVVTPADYPDPIGPYEEMTRSRNAKSGHYDQNTNRLSWGNAGATVGILWQPGFGNLKGDLYYSSYSSSYWQEHEYRTDSSETDTYGFDKSNTRNRISDLGIKIGYLLPFSNSYRLQIGTGGCRHRFVPEEIKNEHSHKGIYITDNNNYSSIMASEGWIYMDNEITAGKILALNVGVRGEVFRIYGKNLFSLDPRATARISLGTYTSLKASFGRMTQYMQQVSNNYINLPTDLWQPIPHGFKPLECDQFSLGAYGILPYTTFLSIEGWYKSMKGVLEYKEGVSVLEPQLTWEEKLTSGKGWSYGVDLALTKETGTITGTLGYGLMWAWRKFADLNGGEKFPAKFDNRHKININISYKLNSKIEFNAGWVFMTGNRMTLSLYDYDYPSGFPGTPSENFLYSDGTESSINLVSSINNVRIPDYHRLDLGMQLQHTYRNGNRGLWNFSLYNAYCRMNPITIQKHSIIEKEGSQTSVKVRNSFRTLSFIPIIPSFSYTYIF